MSPTALLLGSWRAWRAHPVIASSLGFAVVLSIAAIIFGIGALSTPWFVCEIFALQLVTLGGAPHRRASTWIRAGLLVLGLVGLVVAGTWLAVLSFGPDVATIDTARTPMPLPDALRLAGTVLAVMALAIGFIAPFVYAPLILIERGGSLGAAVVESAWLVRRAGLVRHWALVFAAHLLPLAPAIIAAVFTARTFERAATPVGILVALPLLPFSVPLGLGLVTAAYAERRSELAERRWERAEAKPPRALVVLLGLIVLAPMASVAMLMIGAARPLPARPSCSTEPGELVLERAIDALPVTLTIPDTTLELSVDEQTLAVRASDGLGTGRLASGLGAAPDRVLVRRHADRFAIEARRETRQWASIVVDRAGVRVDDTVHDRLWGRVPVWGLPMIALAFLLGAILLPVALASLGATRHIFSDRADRLPPPDERFALRASALRQVTWIAIVLAIPSLAACTTGLMALVR